MQVGGATAFDATNTTITGLAIATILTVGLDAIALDPLTVTAVPEPGTMALLGVALAGLGWSRRKQ